MTDEQVKIAVIGDEEIGKTCLLMSFRPSAGSECPSIFNSIRIEKELKINGNLKPVPLILCDTGADNKYLQLRCKAYKKVDVILICFDILNLSSLQSVDTKWMQETQEYAPDALLILVGLKSDKRSKTGNENDNDTESENENEVPMDIINEYVSKYNFIDYIETSALKKKNINTAFEVGISSFISSGGIHRRSTQIPQTEDEDEDDIDIVGTHQKQWTQHLKDTGMTDEDIFAQYSNGNNTASASAKPSASMGGTMAAMVGSAQFAEYNMNMLQQQQMMGMSYQSQQYGGYGGMGANGHAANVVIDEDKETDLPPPPPQSPGSMKLTKLNDNRLGGSIDYGLEDIESDTPKKGCCVIL